MKQTYAEKIIQVFRANNIFCSHDQATGLVCVLYSGRFGEVYSMYGCLEQAVISNFSVYAQPIPQNKYQQVGKYLSGLNKDASPVNFYLDKDTGCMVFFSQYLLSPADDDNMEGLSKFCLEIHHICINYQVICHQVLNDCGISTPGLSL